MARWLLWWAGVLGAACGARELDPAGCAARFDVQRDKIIRTEESRDMGARYLSELDVGARQECLRLCCETDACDVFVYEEKGPGSCYLFACGPPEDFRCKFTAHGNFSSGVMALSRRLAELQDRERDQLATLRSGASSARPPAPPAPPPRPSPAPPRPDPLLTHTGRCSRYQFECRRGGECIAVYNACDGVPQCADGSDEAPELGCPTAAPPPPPPRPTPALHLTTSRTPPQESVEQLSANEGFDLEASAAASAAASAGERWPHRLVQAQLQHRYSEPAGGSHIFSHKGGLLQEAEVGPPPPPPPPYPAFEPPVAWPRRAWPQHQSMESMGGWGGAGAAGGGAYPRLDWGERAWPVPPPRPDPEEAYAPPPPPPAAPRTPTPPRPASAAPPPRPTTTVPPHNHPHNDKTATAARVSPAASGVAGAGAGAEGDGLSEHPPAAVLLLVLGMVMTVGLGGMLGCRAGAARRRLRRGKPLAHDADYLVNGMYL